MEAEENFDAWDDLAQAKPTEEELAAKWEAEMAAAGLLDELMDDEDDLLPDDAVPDAPQAMLLRAKTASWTTRQMTSSQSHR